MPEPLKRSHIKREAAQARAYSQAVITEGGRTIWLAGQVAIEDWLGDRFTQLRREIFADNFPASALITVAGLARPEMLVEVQGVAVAR